ncbi:MAG: hypothetical protein NVS3B14_03890 [Ktedonobacteraceae bacterium]
MGSTLRRLRSGKSKPSSACLPEVFSPQAGKREKSEEALIASLYQQIGQLKVQVDWLEKIKISPLRQNGRSSSQHIQS